MRILIVSQYFWPEYFRVNDLAFDLKNKFNNQLDILTGYPNYPRGDIYPEFKKNKKKYSKLGKINIYRVPLITRRSGTNFWLFLNYISFLFSGLIYGAFLLRKKKYDVIITFATSPILVAIISIFLAKLKKAKHVIWVLDLWPEVLSDLEIIKKNSLLYKIFYKVIKLIYKHSDLILTQSLSFRKEIKKVIYSEKKEISYFPSWPEDIKQKNNINKEKFDKSYKNILFAGNIGESQNFKLILSMMKNLKYKKVKLHIIGEGRYFNYIKKIIDNQKLQNVILYGLKNFDDIQNFFKQSDYLLISLKSKKTFNATIPGKFQTYLKYKKPIIGIIGGEVNYIINKYKIGVAISGENIQKIRKKLDLLFSNKIKIKKENFDKLLNIFSRDRNINKLSLMLKNLTKKTEIRLVNSFSAVNLNSNFIVSGLNLAFLGYLSNGQINPSKNLILWPDGFFKKKFFPNSVRKIPGRDFINTISLKDSNIKRIFVLGSLPYKSKKFLEEKFIIEIIHINLPYGNLNDFVNLIPIFNEDEICITTLPTPKQEILANYVAKTQKNFKFICIGGAINMASGVEKVVPRIMQRFFVGETIWRLQFDTRRRIKRLILTLYYYIQGEFFNKFNDLVIVNQKNEK